MSSLFDHGSIRTAAVEQVVAPIASHLCHLVLLCDSEEGPEQFGRLEAAAQALARATENMAAEASRHISETDDEVLRMEMASLLEPVTVSGQHVLLAAQKLSIQPGLGEHREELITATQNVFLKLVEVLLVDDEAAVRRVVAAADQVLEQLSELGSSPDMKSLLRSFRPFSEALCALHSLTVERADSLQDPTQSKQLIDSLETLRKCISMLHTAMCTTIKHPTSEPAQAAKRFILDKVQSTVGDIIMTLKGEFPRSSQSPFGYYTERRIGLLQILTSSPTSSVRSSGFDIMVRDLVFHCMLVANSSRREFHQKLVGQCRHILQFWSDIKRILKSSDDPDEQSLENTFILLVQQIHILDNTLIPTILYQVLDTFSTAFSTFEELSNVMRQIMLADSPIKMDLNFIQALIEDFISSTDGIIQVANFMSAVAVDTKSLENIENSRACLTRLRERIAPLSLELADNAMQTALKLHDVCQKWEEETAQLQDALSDVMDVREFTNIAIHEMVNDRHGCDSAYREQSYKLFNEHATNLICHMKLVIQSVRRHLDRSDDPIYRNGLRVLLKQVQTSQTKAEEAVKDMLLGSQLNVEAYSTFSDSVSRVIQHFKVLREGLDGEQHPHLLSPLRERVHQPEIPKLCSPVKETCELTRDHIIRGSGSALWELMEGGSHAEQVEECLNEETTEAEVPHKYASDDLKIPAISAVPKLIHKPLEFDLLPLLYKVITVTKEKDVTMLNQACTGVLELSNCFAQAAKEALAIVDAVDCQTLESFRAELVSLTQLLVQAAQETAMSSAMSTESIYKYSTQFSDLINNIKKVLLPVAGTWYHAVHSALQGNLPTVATTVTQQLNDVMRLCADMVQLLTSSDLTSHDSEETFSSLHHKLNKAQNNTSSLVEISASLVGHVDKLEGLCILWGLSIQILLNSLDKILGTSTVMNHLRPQKQLSVLSENSLRLQEAARITSLSCRSAYKSKQLTRHQDELKILTEAYLKAAEELALMPSLMQLARSEFFQRHVLIKMRVLSGHLSKANMDYDAALKNIVSIAYFAAEHFRKNNAEDSEQKFGKAAQALVENVESVTKIVEDCLNYVSDPRARSNLRSMNDHMSFQISDIISRARLILETQYICDMLTLDVQIQCWSAKAHYMVEEIRKQDGIHPEAKEQIRAGLQGKTLDDVEEVLAAIPPKVKEESVKNFNVAARAKMGLPKMEKDDRTRAGANKTSSLTYTSIFLKQESDSWDTKNNRIVQVTRKMADTICCMTQYLKKKGPIPDKEAFVNAAKDVISSCQSVTQFIRIIANHCLDKQCMVELSLIVEQILTITNQLNIISSVNAVTPGCKSSDEILVKNAQNLLQTVLCGVRAAETACITGLKQPEPNSDGAEATALCFQWKKNLDIHRAQQTCNPETDELGLRKTSSHLVAPSLISPVTIRDGYS